MEKQQFINSTLAMIDNAITNNEFHKKVERLVNSGAIDIESQQEDNYTTRKAILHVLFNEFARQWQPLTKEGREEAKNLSLF